MAHLEPTHLGGKEEEKRREEGGRKGENREERNERKEKEVSFGSIRVNYYAFSSELPTTTIAENQSAISVRSPTIPRICVSHALATTKRIFRSLVVFDEKSSWKSVFVFALCIIVLGPHFPRNQLPSFIMIAGLELISSLSEAIGLVG